MDVTALAIKIANVEPTCSGKRYRFANTNAHESAFAVTDAGRVYLLLSSIVERLDIEGSTAASELTPEIADELAVFGADRKQLPFARLSLG